VRLSKRLELIQNPLIVLVSVMLSRSLSKVSRIGFWRRLTVFRSHVVFVRVALGGTGNRHGLLGVWITGFGIVLTRLVRIAGLVYVGILSQHSYVQGCPCRDGV